MSDHVYIYVIGREEGPVKVGISSKPWRRVSNIQTSCPFKVELLFAMPAKDRAKALNHEKAFHEIFSDNRNSGEWFDLDADQAIEFIETDFEFEQFFEDRRVLEEMRRRAENEPAPLA